MITDNGIFFEFVPFNKDNFDEEGNLLPEAKAIWIADVEEQTEYALLMTTNAGAYRYLIGDTIIFTNKTRAEIQITGRTKQFLSVCGEHLSLDNMSRAIEILQQKLNVEICEFTVMSESHENLFGHRWYLATEQEVDSKKAAKIIDEALSIINDDYRVERLEAIKNVAVEIHSCKVFYNYMESKGKLGGANKFPRVMKGERAIEWQEYLSSL